MFTLRSAFVYLPQVTDIENVSYNFYTLIDCLYETSFMEYARNLLLLPIQSSGENRAERLISKMSNTNTCTSFRFI